MVSTPTLRVDALTSSTEYINPTPAIEKKIVSALWSIRSKAAMVAEGYTDEYLGTGAFSQDDQPPDYVQLQQRVTNITNGSNPADFFLHRYDHTTVR